MAHGEDKPDISKADFLFARIASEWGWGEKAIASRLMEVSPKAKQNGASLCDSDRDQSRAIRAAQPVPRKIAAAGVSQ